MVFANKNKQAKIVRGLKFMTYYFLIISEFNWFGSVVSLRYPASGSKPWQWFKSDI
jgi:hypothetical protein